MRRSFRFLIGGNAFPDSSSRKIRIAEMNRERSVSVHVFFLLFVIHFFDFLVKVCYIENEHTFENTLDKIERVFYTIINQGIGNFWKILNLDMR